MDFSSILLLGILTAVLLGVAMLAMGVGAIFKRKCLRGSCGGAAVRDANGEMISCPECPKRGTQRNCADGQRKLRTTVSSDIEQVSRERT